MFGLTIAHIKFCCFFHLIHLLHFHCKCFCSLQNEFVYLNSELSYKYFGQSRKIECNSNGRSWCKRHFLILHLWNRRVVFFTVIQFNRWMASGGEMCTELTNYLLFYVMTWPMGSKSRNVCTHIERFTECLMLTLDVIMFICLVRVRLLTAGLLKVKKESRLPMAYGFGFRFSIVNVQKIKIKRNRI